MEIRTMNHSSLRLDIGMKVEQKLSNFSAEKQKQNENMKTKTEIRGTETETEIF
jgi:hypothetical protein